MCFLNALHARFITSAKKDMYLRAGVQPTLDPYAEAFLWQDHCARGGYVIIVVCLFVSNFAQKRPNGFA